MDFFRGFKAPSKFAQEFLFFTDGLGHLKSENFFIDRVGFNNQSGHACAVRKATCGTKRAFYIEAGRKYYYEAHG